MRHKTLSLFLRAISRQGTAYLGSHPYTLIKAGITVLLVYDELSIGRGGTALLPLKHQKVKSDIHVYHTSLQVSSPSVNELHV